MRCLNRRCARGNMPAMSSTSLLALRLRRSAFALALVLALAPLAASLGSTGCKAPEKKESGTTGSIASGASIPTPSVVPPSSAGLAVRASASAAAAAMVDGAKLLAVFPPVGLDGATAKTERPTKEGFAEVVYKKGDAEVATVTITDTSAVPAVRDDYKDAKEKVGDSPLKTSGNYKSAMLVADRFQVQIQSQRLKAPQRQAWLEKVDVAALGKLR